MTEEKKIFVFADFLSHHEELIGTLYAANVKGKEVFSFEYDSDWLKNDAFFFDPDLQFYSGRQYLNDDRALFGLFSDSCPDRWGRLLMKRREAILAKKANRKPRKLLESDFLLGVHDKARMGALRFKTEPSGAFLSASEELAAPPWPLLRELEHAAAAFEKDESGLEEKWLRQLLAPGSSLGGARPKASVMAPDGSLWIAKFPSKYDEWNIGAWEMVVHDLASMCGLNVPEAKLENFSKFGSTYLVKRFDRDGESRIHFSSAMTMLGKKDGATSEEGNSYLEIASFLKANGARPKQDLQELWKRIVFSMAVSNTDDHFRNHGFLLSDDGWILSPMYDVNPDIYGNNLSLNVNEAASDIDYQLAVDSAAYYEVSISEAKQTVAAMDQIVKNNFDKLASKYGISRGEIKKMEPAFSVRIP